MPDDTRPADDDTRPADDTQGEWTTPAREAREVGIRRSTIKRAIKEGKLRAYNFGTSDRPNYRIRVSDFEEYLASLQVAPEAKPVRRQRRDATIPRYV